MVIPPSGLRVFDQLSKDPEMQDLLAWCSQSTKFCAKFLFPERFYAEFSPLHDQIFEAIDSGAQKIAIAAPRGIGKTSIVGLALTARAILFNLRRFIAYVSMSHDNALLQTENLKMELLTNKLIKRFFGSVKTQSDEDLDESFSKKAWVAHGRTLILPRGSGQQIRGLLYRNSRPDLFIVDDLEDPDTIESDEIRAKRKQWFFADLVKATSRTDPNWQIIYIDTLKHHDALLQHLLEDPTWLTLRQEICGDDLKSNAPSFMSDEQVRAEYDSHKAQGLLDVFAREFRNIPISKEDAAFKPEYFKYCDESEFRQLARTESVVILDPAKTTSKTADKTAIVGVGLDMQGNGIYVRDVVNEKMHPDQMINEAFAMARRIGARVIGVEVTSLCEFITQPIKNEMMARGEFYELVELKPRGGGNQTMSKAQRIGALVPYYRQGYVYHNPQCCAALEQQLMEFPRPRYWDIMDALAYIVEMMDMGDRFFQQRMDPEEEYDPEAEFRELKGWQDEPLGDSWRILQ